MNTETDYLKRIADDIAANKDQTKYNAEPDHHMEYEAGRLEKDIRESLLAIDNFTRRDTFHFDTLVKLVDICDTLFEAGKEINANVKVLIKLLTAVKQIIPAEIRPNLRLPKAFVLLQNQPFLDFWAANLEVLKAQDIDARLLDIAAIPFQEFTEPKHNLYWGNYNWLKAYERKLETMDWKNADCNSKTEALISLLIASGFNDDQFFVYCKNSIQQRTSLKAGRWEKLKELAYCRKLILQDSRAKSCPFRHKLDPLVTQLLVWITAEEEYVNTHEPEQPFAKLGFQWYKYTLAFFFKLLHEQKVFGGITYRELSEQIASTCTAMGAYVPADTMIKKPYLKKQTDFKSIETLLVNMLAYIRSFMPKE